MWVLLGVCGPECHSLQSGPGQGKTVSPFFSVWVVHLETVGTSETADGFSYADVGYTLFTYLLMRGCCSDSKTRLQLSRHLFTPRISTRTSEEENTDVVLVLPVKEGLFSKEIFS